MITYINEEGLLKINSDILYADDNIVYSYKNRTINLEQPIRVYRNLTKKGTWYSIKQKELVVAHSKRLCMRDCSFIVNQKGRDWFVKNNKRIVHAYIEGYYISMWFYS